MSVDDDERRREKFSHTSLRHISQICGNNDEYVPKHMKTLRSTCQNINRVRVEYILSTRKMGTRLWAPSPWGGVIIEELPKRASKGMETILKIRNSHFYENFYSIKWRMLSVFDKSFGYFIGKDIILYIFLKT